MQPMARSEKLTVRQVLEDTIVYDEVTRRAHSLNPAVALVWKNCDGQNGLPELSQLLAAELNTSLAEAEAMAELAIEQLSRRGLLAEESPRADAVRRYQRREVLRHLAAACVAIPLIMTIKAPAVAQNASLRCKTAGETCSGINGQQGSCCAGLICDSPGAAPGANILGSGNCI